MNTLEFVKKNAFVVAGILLPIVVVLFVALASTLSRTFVPPPAYDVVFSAMGGSRQPPVTNIVVTADVVDGRLQLKARKTEQPGYTTNYIPRLYVYSHVEDSVREIRYELPDVSGVPADGIDIPVEEFAKKRFSPSTRAPDGYAFSAERGSGRGLLGELFYSSNYRDRPVIKRDGAAIVITPPPSDGYYYNIRFLGWVVGETETGQ